MTDVVDSKTRSRMMGAIGAKDTKPELQVRRWLHASGFRFRLHARELDGRPDIVLRKYRALIFVHGCFWHRHPRCRYATVPSSRQDFWQAKFEDNVARDRRNHLRLLEAGWRVATVWECALRGEHRAHDSLNALQNWITSGGTTHESSSFDEVDRSR